MNKGNIIIKEIKIIYFWYNHLNPKVNTKDIEQAINNHNWEQFKKWLVWQKKQKLVYFPEYADMYINGEYFGELLINEQTFNLITDNEYECG